MTISGKTISDTLVIPYQKEINGEMYRITEVNLHAEGVAEWDEGYSLPKVETIIYPNTVEKIYGMWNGDGNSWRFAKFLVERSGITQ